MSTSDWPDLTSGSAAPRLGQQNLVWDGATQSGHAVPAPKSQDSGWDNYPVHVSQQRYRQPYQGPDNNWHTPPSQISMKPLSADEQKQSSERLVSKAKKEQRGADALFQQQKVRSYHVQYM